MKPSLATLLVALILAIPAMAQFVQPLVIGGAQPHIVSTKITQVAFCSNNTCSFTPGTTNAIGQGVVTLSNGGMFSGTWTMPTTGTATNPPGASCPDNSAFFTISSAGVLTSTAQSAAQTYMVCIGASQPGLSAPNPYVQVVTLNPSAGVSCDIGPPYTGAIPAAARQASFTHCAANYDFTYTGSFTDSVGTHQWSNLSTWLSCSPTTSAPYLWYRGNPALGGPYSPCDTSHQYITSVAGTQVLALTFLPADGPTATVNTITSIYPGSSLDASNPFRMEAYTESVLQFSSTSATCSGFCVLFALSTFHAFGSNPCFVSTDQEWDNGASGSGVGFAQWNPTCGTSGGYGGSCAAANCASPVNCPTTTSVTTRGSLVTGDRVSQLASNNSCATGSVAGLQGGAPPWLSSLNITIVPPSNSVTTFDTPLFMYLAEGPQSSQSSFSHTTYVYRITVWECTGYATGTCVTNPVITTAP